MERAHISLRLLRSHLDKIDEAVEAHNDRGDGTNPQSRTSFIVSASLEKAKREAAAALYSE